jgi:hypothetical protein
VWRVERDLQLLNISNTAVRQHLIATYGLNAATLDCNEQYAAGLNNRAAHRQLQVVIDEYQLDGTIIRERDADEDCDGATEVVVLSSRLDDAVKLVTIDGESLNGGSAVSAETLYNIYVGGITGIVGRKETTSSQLDEYGKALMPGFYRGAFARGDEPHGGLLPETTHSPLRGYNM